MTSNSSREILTRHQKILSQEEQSVCPSCRATYSRNIQCENRLDKYLSGKEQVLEQKDGPNNFESCQSYSTVTYNNHHVLVGRPSNKPEASVPE